jgi:hypothetical protein
LIYAELIAIVVFGPEYWRCRFRRVFPQPAQDAMQDQFGDGFGIACAHRAEVGNAVGKIGKYPARMDAMPD